MAENTELEDLDHLVHSPGWQRFTAMVEKEWGYASDRYIRGISDAARADNQHGMDHLRQMIACQREIQHVMQMIPLRLKALQGAEKPELAVVGSRRGGL